jgi:sec-independent protein translocase protein TatB
MLDVGWPELLVIAIVLIVVVGPKDLPPMLRAFGKMTARLRTMAGEFRSQFDDALKEADLDDVRKTISDAQRLNPVNSLREAMNPLRQMGSEIKSDLQKSVKSPAAATAAEETAAVEPLVVPEPAMKLPVEPPVIATAPEATPSAEPAVKTAKPATARKPRASKATAAKPAEPVAPPLPAAKEPLPAAQEKPVAASAARKAAAAKAGAKPVAAKAEKKPAAASKPAAPKKPAAAKKTATKPKKSSDA